MENGQLPKSLHTVRILVAVTAERSPWYRNGTPQAVTQAVLQAAAIIGYDDASASDPLIEKAVAQLARETLRSVA